MGSDKQPDGSAFMVYMVASSVTWVITGAMTALFYGRGDLPLGGAIAIVGVLIGTDLALFPRRRRYYTAEPAQRRMIGEEGVAASDLAPRGFVRVHGELWQAEAMSPEHTIREGDTLRVRGIHGLELIVDPSNKTAPGRRLD